MSIRSFLASPLESSRAALPRLRQVLAGNSVFLAWFLLVGAAIVFVRLFQLDAHQNEMYGDMDSVRDFVRQVLVGGWPTQFNLSAGPLYEYLITPLILITGLNYAGLKLASVLVSLAGLAATYAFSRRLVDDYFALLVVFVAGVSSWLLIFSRLGNSQILLPLLTMLALWLVIRIVQYGRRIELVACAAISCLGLFVYPQSFILPGVIFLTLLGLRLTGKSLPRHWALVFILVCLPFLLFFAQIVASAPDNFTSGYVGSKIELAPGQSVLGVLAGNFVNAMLALHVRGDGNFRSNPASLPHLDLISGLLFLGGAVYWCLTPERRRWLPLWLVPLILLQVPSMLVLNQPDEIPSASRTLAVAPLVYMLVASGLWGAVQYLRARKLGRVALPAAGLLLAVILFLNTQRYFQDYLAGLPYQDTPIAHTVAVYANGLPDDTQFYMVGCCWEQGMPELFVKYDMARPETMQYLDAASLSCSQLQTLPLPAVLIWSFHDDLPAPQLVACSQWLSTQTIDFEGRPVFKTASLHPDPAPPAAPTPAIVGSLWETQLDVNGQQARVDYSPLEIGPIANLFDGDPDTLIRGQPANPLVVTLHFDPPRPVGGIDLTLGSMPHFQVELTATYTDQSTHAVGNEYRGMPPKPEISLTLPGDPQPVSALSIVVRNMNPPGPDGYHIYLIDLQLR